CGPCHNKNPHPMNASFVLTGDIVTNIRLIIISVEIIIIFPYFAIRYCFNINTHLQNNYID
ncbi:MAG: hypothetical protein WB511_07530, partial [Nitrososphaeraceae archaeon]